MQKQEQRTGFLFVLPALIVLALVVLYPLMYTFYLSFQHKVLIQPNKDGFVGLANYIEIFSSGATWKFVGTTLIFTLSSVTLKLAVGLFAALLLNKNYSGVKFYSSLLMIPWFIPSVVASLIWSWILHDQFGILNQALQSLHLIEGNIVWLGDKTLALIAVVLVDVWVGLPFMTVVFLGGLKTIPKEMLEAAEIDGANYLQKLIYVIIQSLKNVFIVMGTISLIGTFNSFNIIYTLTGGGPVEATNTLVIHIYRTAFTEYNFGLSSTLAVFTFIIIIFLVLFYRKRLDEEGTY
ncbi:carbohydrate ABC transporter permease [Bacillus sp. Marseille-P3661]|uniref:carbohydrate ABC transporter permease n=1 Tax=Bacillus sp. Marseille-P3661 TaxID=1936234 RepID=UPI0015E15F01|nr:sugar ABC transporter permease [Bacillus sp. Marseille-P3661]